MFPTIVSYSTRRFGPYLFYMYIERFITQFKRTEKMIIHHTCLRQNDDFPLWRSPAVKKELPFFNVCADHMHSRDAQCYIGEIDLNWRQD